MPIIIRPSGTPDRELDLTRAITAAVAHELWRHGGGNDVLNWLEAERLVSSLSVATRRAVRRLAGRGHDPGRRPAPSASAPRPFEPERASGPVPRR